MRRLILVFGVMGLVGCFLPMYYDYDGPESWSLWQLRHDLPAAVYGVIAAYATATGIGLSRRITRWHGVVAAVAFGFVAYMLWPPIPVFVLVGWYLLQLSAFAGCATSVAVAFAGTPEVSEPV